MIKFTTINVDGNEVSRQFNSIEEVLIDWYQDGITTLPCSDDIVISFMVGDTSYLGTDIFEDIVEQLQYMYWNKLSKLKA